MINWLTTTEKHRCHKNPTGSKTVIIWQHWWKKNYILSLPIILQAILEYFLSCLVKNLIETGLMNCMYRKVILWMWSKSFRLVGGSRNIKVLLNNAVMTLIFSYRIFSDQRGWIPATHLEHHKPLCSSGYQSVTSLDNDCSNSDNENRSLSRSALTSFDDCLGQSSLDVFPGDIMVTIHDYQADRDDELSFPHASLVQVKIFYPASLSIFLYQYFS